MVLSRVEYAFFCALQQFRERYVRAAGPERRGDTMTATDYRQCDSNVAKSGNNEIRAGTESRHVRDHYLHNSAARRS